MGLASFLLFLALPQAQAGPDNAGACTAYVVESSCTNVSKTCAGLFEKEELPKGEACGTPKAVAAFDAHMNAWSARNPNVPWGMWRREREGMAWAAAVAPRARSRCGGSRAR